MDAQPYSHKPKKWTDFESIRVGDRIRTKQGDIAVCVWKPQSDSTYSYDLVRLYSEVGGPYILNARLGWRIEKTLRGFALFNGQGFAGTFDTLESAIQAHEML